MGLCGLLFLVVGGPVARLFNPDPAVTRLAGELLLFAAAFQLFDAVATVHLSALRGAGDTRFTLLVTSAAAWLLTVPAAAGLGLALGWGARGAWLGLTLELGVLAGVTGWRISGLASGRVGRMDLLLGRSAS
jgi:MATE family multidrug resistance protein